MTAAPLPNRSLRRNGTSLRTQAVLTFVLGCAAALSSAGCRRKPLLPRGDGEAVVLVAPDAGDEGSVAAAVVASPESEPNNSVATAQKVFVAPWPLMPGAVVGDQPLALAAGPVWAVDAELTNPADIDTFRVALVPPGGFLVGPTDAGSDAASATDPAPSASLAVSLVLADSSSGNGVTLTLQSQGPAGRILQQTTSGEPLAIPNAGLVAGEDLLVTVARAKRGKAASANGGLATRVAYRLVVKAAALLAGEETEPNAEPRQASLLRSPTATIEAGGFLGWRQDTDWFALSFPPMDADFALSIELHLPAEALADLSVATDDSGKSVHGYARPVRGKLRLVGVAVPKEGPLWLRVRNGGAAVLNQRYRLTASAVQLAPGYEREPNDTLANAMPATAPTQFGFMHPAGDVDTLMFCGSAGAPLVVESPARLDLTVVVADAGGAEVSSGLAVGGQKTTLAPLPDTACSVIQIREKSGKVSNLLDPYTIRAER